MGADPLELVAQDAGAAVVPFQQEPLAVGACDQAAFDGEACESSFWDGGFRVPFLLP